MQKIAKSSPVYLILAILSLALGTCASQARAKEYLVPIIPDDYYDVEALGNGFDVWTPEEPDAVLEIPDDPDARIMYLVEHIGDPGLTWIGTPLGYELNAVAVELVRCGTAAGPPAHAAFRKALREGDRRKTELLVCVLGRLGYKESFDDVALLALEHSCWSLGASAIWSLPRIDRDRAVPVLIELLYPDPAMEDDWPKSRIPVTHALSKAVGKSFPAPCFHPGESEPVAVWENRQKWCEWARAQNAAAMAPLSESIKSALERRRQRRLREE